MKSNPITGKRLKDLREKYGLTQGEVSKRTGICKSSLSAYENSRRMPGSAKLCQLADLYSVSVDYLLGKTDLAVPVNALNKPIDPSSELTFSSCLISMNQFSKRDLRLLGWIIRINQSPSR